MGLMDWLYRNGEVTSREDNEDGSVSITLEATAGTRREIDSRLQGRS
jgi:GTP-binding protein HflX